MGKQIERDLNWQIVNLKVPVEELHDAPILYIAGNQALDFTDDEQAKLRQFVEQGGMILGNADCGSPTPSPNSFRKLGKKLFPSLRVPRAARRPPDLHQRAVPRATTGRTSPASWA